MIRNQKLRKLLDSINIEDAFDVDFKGGANVNTYCPFHEDPQISQSMSCSVSNEGLFNCKGCNIRGDAFDFYARSHNTTRDQAIEDLREKVKTESKQDRGKTKHKKRTLVPDMVAHCQKTLQRNTPFQDYLRVYRGINEATIEAFELGCDERRITIPVYDESGLLVNMRRYLPDAKSSPKMLSYGEGYGAPRLFPIHKLEDNGKPIVLCEGEWDCMLLWQEGYIALTVTGGVSTWRSSFNEVFIDRTVYIIYDVNDKQGDVAQRIAWERARMLREVGAHVKVVRLDLPITYKGGDITDYFIQEGHSSDELDYLIENTAFFTIPAESNGQTSSAAEDQLIGSEAEPVTLGEASQSKYYYKKIKLRGLVAGKGVSPYLPPHHVSLEITDEEGATQIIDHVFDKWNGAILALVRSNTARMYTFIRALLGVPKKATAKIKILDTFNMEEIYLIPAVDLQREEGPYVLRKCFYVGHGLLTNRVYEFEGYTLPDPASQAATHILTTATPSETDVETFELTEDARKQLIKIFQTNNVQDKLDSISDNLAEHVTKIYGRPELHIAVDLVYHSVLAFDFDNTRLHKGWLDVLILGDTRTGKGFVTEGLCQHYKVGEVVSGENITLAGLIGGVQQLGDRWTLVWGKIPLADKRLIVIDEVSALGYSDIGRMSRVRSEGIAEITKIVSEKTTSRTRLLWLANPKPKQAGTKILMSDYNYGIEAVAELIGAAEDVARFDYVLIVAHDEVSSDLINKQHTPSSLLEYSSEDCHNLIMWIWSREPNHIVFDKGAESLVMKLSRELSNQFTSKIPLVQGEDVRFKLARIAVAAAGRTFSTPDGIHLIVRKEHVEFSYNFIHRLYSRPSCGYMQLSVVEKERATLRNPKAVYAALQNAGELLPDLIDGLLEHRQLNARDLCDYAGLDIHQARSIISELVRHRALIKEYANYVKKPAFKAFLHALKQEVQPDIPSTVFAE